MTYLNEKNETNDEKAAKNTLKSYAYSNRFMKFYWNLCLRMLTDAIHCTRLHLMHSQNWSVDEWNFCKMSHQLREVSSKNWAVNWISCVFRCFVRLKSSNLYFNGCVCQFWSMWICLFNICFQTNEEITNVTASTSIKFMRNISTLRASDDDVVHFGFICLMPGTFWLCCSRIATLIKCKRNVPTNGARSRRSICSSPAS